MSILSNIKKGVANSGSNKAKVLYLKDGAKTRIRFLEEIEDALEISHHDSFQSGINFFDQEQISGEAHELQDDKDLRHRMAYVWSVWDYESKEVKLFIGYPNNFSPLPALIGMYESYDTITDRDYVITRSGSQLQTSYTVVPMDKVRFKNKKAKPYSIKKKLSILDKAFPAPDEGGSSSGKRKGRKREDDDDYEDDDYEDEYENENEYDDLSPRELYRECIERGLEVKKKKKKSYYIDLLLEDDEDEDDDWEDDDEDEDDDW